MPYIHILRSVVRIAVLRLVPGSAQARFGPHLSRRALKDIYIHRFSEL